MPRKQDRVAYLDGLRGCAIFLVVGWHYTGPSYARFLPFGMALSGMQPFAVGWIGVQLFFLISGYVIVLTLEQCDGFRDFMVRRWIRLWPALVLASLLVFALSQGLGGFMPGGRHLTIDLLPSLTLINPAIWRALLHRPVNSIDYVHWTLYTEWAFYLAIGFLYFRLGWRRALAALVALWLFALFLPPLVAALPPGPWRQAPKLLRWLGVPLFSWFASGALFFKAHRCGSDRLFALAILLGCVSAAVYSLAAPIDDAARIGLFLCVALFAAAQRWRALQRLLANRPIQFLGFISYPYYLLHAEVGVALMGLAGRHMTPAAAMWLPLPVALLTGVLAWIVARFYEPPVMRWLRARMHRDRGYGAPSAPPLEGTQHGEGTFRTAPV